MKFEQSKIHCGWTNSLDLGNELYDDGSFGRSTMWCVILGSSAEIGLLGPSHPNLAPKARVTNSTYPRGISRDKKNVNPAKRRRRFTASSSKSSPTVGRDALASASTILSNASFNGPATSTPFSSSSPAPSSPSSSPPLSSSSSTSFRTDPSDLNNSRSFFFCSFDFRVVVVVTIASTSVAFPSSTASTTMFVTALSDDVNAFVNDLRFAARMTLALPFTSSPLSTVGNGYRTPISLYNLNNTKCRSVS
mmetsp:Transcript_57224/g.139524  ORF Transcript_57224/g.139524 Transcript_57224/m.139524 type:complete len:249 (+) Transcript_57224:755-1501(+)